MSKETKSKEANLGLTSKVEVSATESTHLFQTQTPKEKIELVFKELGEILDERKKAYRKQNVDQIRNIRLNKWEKSVLIFLASTLIIWPVGLIAFPSLARNVYGLLIFLVNMILFSAITIYIFSGVRNYQRRGIQEVIESITPNALSDYEAGYRVAKVIDKDKEIIESVTSNLKSDIDLFQAKIKTFSDFLKNLNPVIIAIGVLFGIPNIASGNSSMTALIITVVGAAAVLINSVIELGMQPEIIRRKECIAILEQAQLISSQQSIIQPNDSYNPTAR